MARTPSAFRFLLPALLCAALLLVLTGCGDRDRLSYATEADEPYYKEGLSLLKTGRRQEALSAFLKVIDKRGEDAPESHLEIGLLYQQHINDPLSAIFHFKKYLALRPNNPQAPLVRQRIDGCIREFARTLPAQPLDNATKRVDLIATMDKLKVENDQLKQQLADLKANRESALLTAGTPSVDPASTLGASDSNLLLTLDPIPTVRTRPTATPVKPVIPAPASNARDTSRTKPNFTMPAPPLALPRQATSTPVRRAPRQHTVTKGDTLSNLAQRYYKDRARWRDIYAANRKVMKNEGDLLLGMELVIP